MDNTTHLGLHVPLFQPYPPVMTVAPDTPLTQSRREAWGFPDP